jgi:hypothetical protein
MAAVYRGRREKVSNSASKRTTTAPWTKTKAPNRWAAGVEFPMTTTPPQEGKGANPEPWVRSGAGLSGMSDDTAGLEKRGTNSAWDFRMRRLCLSCFMAGIVILGSGRPSAAVIIYPWCANYGGRNSGVSCGSTSLQQGLATLWGNGGSCGPNPFYEPYPPPPTYSPPIKR